MTDTSDIFFGIFRRIRYQWEVARMNIFGGWNSFATPERRRRDVDMMVNMNGKSTRNRISRGRGKSSVKVGNVREMRLADFASCCKLFATYLLLTSPVLHQIFANPSIWTLVQRGVSS